MPIVTSFFETEGQGEFSLLDLSLTMLNAWDPIDGEAIGALPDEQQRLDAWMAKTAYFHEIRHYHDLIGSCAGVSVFLETTRLVDDLVVSIRSGAFDITSTQQRHDTSGPAAIYREHRDFLAAALGETYLPATEEDSNALEYSVQEYRGRSLEMQTAYPMVPVPYHDPFTGELKERMCPLGLRSLMEHTATELQMFMAAIGAGDDPHATDDPIGRGRRFLMLHEGLMKGGFLPYYLVRTTAQYRLVTQRSDEPVTSLKFLPPLATLVPFVQAALDVSGFAAIDSPSGGYDWEFEHPGLAFMHLLADYTGQEGSIDGEIAAADRAVQRLLGRSWQDFLVRYVAQLERSPASVFPPIYAPEAAKTPLIANVRHAVLQDHLEIVRSRAANLRVWADPTLYLKELANLPQPAIHLTGPTPTGGATAEKAAIFIGWAILLEALQSLMEAGVARCPLKDRLQTLGPILRFPDYAGKDTTCAPFISTNRCGAYDGAFRPGQPASCPFTTIITRVLHQQERPNAQAHRA